MLICSCPDNSDARDRLLVALGRLLDGLVDVLAIGASTEGIDAAVRDDLAAKVSSLVGGSDDERDVYAVYMVRTRWQEAGGCLPE